MSSSPVSGTSHGVPKPVEASAGVEKKEENSNTLVSEDVQNTLKASLDELMTIQKDIKEKLEENHKMTMEMQKKMQEYYLAMLQRNINVQTPSDPSSAEGLPQIEVDRFQMIGVISKQVFETLNASIVQYLDLSGRRAQIIIKNCQNLIEMQQKQNSKS